MEFLFYIIAGAGVGLAVGVTGVGGGSLMTPLLILFGIPFHIAIGTDLLYAALTKAGGVYAHAKQSTIRWRLVILLAAGSLPAALLTTYFLEAIFSGGGNYEKLLTTSLGVMLILTSLVLFFKGRLQRVEVSGSEAGRMQRHASMIAVVAGFVLGVFVTLSSVGAGAFCAALLLVLYPRLPAIQVVGTDIAHAVPLTLIAGLGHLSLSNLAPHNEWTVGNVDFLLLGSLLIGSLPAVYVGTKLGARLPSRILQSILAAILLVLGVKFAVF